MELPLEEVTLAECLRDAGYDTAHIGKWHLGGEGFGPRRQGFTLNIGGDDRGHPPSYFAPFGAKGRPLPGLDDAPAGQYLTERLTVEAERYVAAHRDRPFFLYLPHYAVHTPLQGEPERIAHYPDWDGTPHGRQENPYYAAVLESLDSGVGRVMASLEKAGIADRTIVVFISDNGGLATLEGPHTPATINAPLREGKGWLYEGGVRVPLIVHWPGRVGAGIETAPVSSVDLLPTLLALCGVADDHPRDGLSLAGLLLRGEALSPRSFFWHYPHYSNQGGKPGGAVRRGDHKLIVDDETGRRELFDLARDPRETRNLALERPDLTDRLARELETWREGVGAQRTAPNPDFVPNPQGPDGVVTLPAATAEVHGAQLRYEPLPHKKTLGFWTQVGDWAAWDFELSHPGEFVLEALVGCAAGSEGSVVEFRIDPVVLSLKVPATGGFQSFQPQRLGPFRLDGAGRHRLEVRATSKPGPAVMDLRQVRLVRVGP